MEVHAMISQGASSPVRTRTAAEAIIHGLESWWRHSVLENRDDQGAPKRACSGWSGDARFHLGRARRALDHGELDQAEREAARALYLDHVSPWPLVVLGRCALARNRPMDAVHDFSRAYNRAPNNRYVMALLARAEGEAGLTEESSV
jgi:predicted Zn-dependent protease